MCGDGATISPIAWTRLLVWQTPIGGLMEGCIRQSSMALPRGDSCDLESSPTTTPVVPALYRVSPESPAEHQAAAQYPLSASAD